MIEKQNFSTGNCGCLEASFWQWDAVVFEFLKNCSNSFGLSSKQNDANIWELARNVTGFCFFFMDISRGKKYPERKKRWHRYSAPLWRHQYMCSCRYLSNLSVFRKTWRIQWPWERYVAHLIYKNKLFWTLKSDMANKWGFLPGSVSLYWMNTDCSSVIQGLGELQLQKMMAL